MRLLFLIRVVRESITNKDDIWRMVRGRHAQGTERRALWLEWNERVGVGLRGVRNVIVILS